MCGGYYLCVNGVSMLTVATELYISGVVLVCQEDSDDNVSNCFWSKDENAFIY